jgi:hypothetical protein
MMWSIDDVATRIQDVEEWEDAYICRAYVLIGSSSFDVCTHVCTTFYYKTENRMTVGYLCGTINEVQISEFLKPLFEAYLNILQWLVTSSYALLTLKEWYESPKILH